MTGVSKRYYRNPNLAIASLIIIDDRPVSLFVKYTPSAWDVWGSITGPVKSTVSPTARHRCDVSLEMCCPGAKSRRWASPLVTAFGVLSRV